MKCPENGPGDHKERPVYWNFWRFCGYQQEARQLTQAVLEQTAALPRLIRAKVLRLAGWLAHDIGDYTTMGWVFQASLELSETLGDRPGTGLARQGLGELVRLRGRWQQAHDYLQASLDLFTELDDRRQMAWSQDLMGRLAFSQGNLAAAQARLQESVDGFRALGSTSATASALGHLGQVRFYQGSFEEAEAALEQSLALNLAIGDTRSPGVALALNYLAETALHHQQLARAQEHIDSGLALSQEVGYTGCAELCYFTAGLLALRENQPVTSAKCFRESWRLQQSLNEHWRGLALMEAIAALAVARGDWLGATRLYGAAEQLRASLNIPFLPVYRSLREDSLAQIRKHLIPATLDEAWSAGQSLSYGQAMAYAARCLE